MQLANGLCRFVEVASGLRWRPLLKRWPKKLDSEDCVTAPSFGSTTLCLSSARRRNSFHPSLRASGTANIGIASQLAFFAGAAAYHTLVVVNSINFKLISCT
jgi:hypothetical protein